MKLRELLLFLPPRGLIGGYIGVMGKKKETAIAYGGYRRFFLKFRGFRVKGFRGFEVMSYITGSGAWGLRFEVRG